MVQYIESPLVSVIIPVYNAAPWLEECLGSVISQSLADTEIICINDESPDNCSSILNEYKKKDDRIKIINQKNKGLSGARNTGISAATTKYLMFCDSDDFFKLRHSSLRARWS